jgi:uncharacterized membrane protein HdeD (DUF308 family)
MMPARSLHQFGLEEVKRHWGWYVALGIILVILGTLAIGRTYLLTKVSVLFLGWLLMVAGAFEVTHAFWRERGWGGFFVDLLSGVLYVVVGFMMVANPGASAVALTLLISMYLMFHGLFRIVAAISVRLPNWVWMLLHGVASLVMGILIWRQWPLSGVWVIGLFVGIEMIFNGWTLVMLGLAARKMPLEDAATTSPAT